MKILKDSVLWHKKLALPEAVQRNLQELIQNARQSAGNTNNGPNHPTRDKPQIFPDISSRDVNAYLSGILPGLTAKEFRTHHATIAVRQHLEEAAVKASDPEHVKWETANLANLEAAMLCNHTKKAPEGWPRSRERYKERQLKAEERVQLYREEANTQRDALTALREEAREKLDAASPAQKAKVRSRYQQRIRLAERKLDQTRERLERARLARDKIKAQASIAAKKRTWNLGTSLKSYIDPRVYYAWGRQVDYRVLEQYYPTALQRKFAWVREESEGESSEQGNAS
jgi:DNA topoisomerase-1